MLDGSGAFKGKAAEEIQEEIGVNINSQDLVDLVELAYGSEGILLYNFIIYYYGFIYSEGNLPLARCMR